MRIYMDGVAMIDLQVVLITVFIIVFLYWALIYLGGNLKYIKQFFITLGIWLVLLIVLGATRHAEFPALQVYEVYENAPVATAFLFNNVLSVLCGIMPFILMYLAILIRDKRREARLIDESGNQ